MASMSLAAQPARPRGTRTNRAEHKVRSTKTRACTYHPSDYGIDYLELAFRIKEPGDLKSTRHATWKPKGHDTEDGPVITSGWLEILYRGHTLRLRLYRTELYGWQCYLHFNPARIVNPGGIGLCRRQDLRLVIREVIEVVSDYVKPVGPSDYFSVRRLDLARNFRGITSPTNYLTGLHGVHRPHATSASLIRGRDGRLGTLRSGSPSGGWASLYDKHLQAPTKAPPGTMRFEVQAHRSWCRRYGRIYTVADLTVPNLSRLMRNRLRWFGLEREVMTPETACGKILRNRDLDKREQDGLIRYVLELQAGLDPTACPKSISKYRNRLGELNISPSVDSASDRSVAHLDFRAGAEVRVA